MVIERIPNTGPVQRAKDFLKRLNEEHLAFEQETPEGTQTNTFRQIRGFISDNLLSIHLGKSPKNKPNEEGVHIENSGDVKTS